MVFWDDFAAGEKVSLPMCSKINDEKLQLNWMEIAGLQPSLLS